MSKPTCYCGKKMILRNSRYGDFWGCSNFPRCDGVVGCHPDSSPLGTPANKETRQLRQVAHGVFDNWWPTQFSTRKEAYEWLDENGPKPHIAEMDLGECEGLIEMLEEWDGEQVEIAFERVKHRNIQRLKQDMGP